MLRQRNGLFTQGVLLVITAMLVAAISFIKEIIFAHFFGTSYVSDAYTMAIQVPEVIFAIVWETISAVVVPIYIENLNSGGKKAANKFFSNTLTIICLLSVLVIIIGEIFGDFILRIFFPGSNAETLNLATSLMRWIFPMLFFEGIIRFVTGILNVYHEFAIPKILSSVRNIGIIVFLLLFTQRFGIQAAVIGLLTGIAIECVLCVITTNKYEKYTPVVDFKDQSLKKILYLTLPLLLGIGAREINTIADKIVASFFEAGSISSLNYASKLSSMIEVCILGNVAVLMYPQLARLSAEGKKEQLSLEYSKSVHILILLSIPILLGGCFLREEIVSLIFERGAFNKESVSVVANLFAIYLLCAMFTAINGLSVKLFTACNDTKTPTYNAVFGVIINICLNVVLSYVFGVIGLAIATLLSSIALCLRLYWLSRKKIFKFPIKPTLGILLKSIAAGMMMCLVLVIIKFFIVDDSTFVSVLSKIAYTTLCVILGACVYCISLTAMRVNEITDILKNRNEERKVIWLKFLLSCLPIMLQITLNKAFDLL